MSRRDAHVDELDREARRALRPLLWVVVAVSAATLAAAIWGACRG